MDDFLAAVEADQRKGPRCRAGLMLDELAKADPDLRAKVDVALNAPHLTFAAISRQLAARGWRVPEGTLTRHVRGKCACDR